MKIRKYILIFILLVLSLPLLQQKFQLVTSGGLIGFYYCPSDVDFSWNKWFDGSYQRIKDSFLNENTGFRPDLVRSANQIGFSLFNYTRGAGVIGRHNCMYYEDYIYSYLGTDYRGANYIRKQLVQLKAIQDTFAKLGKTLLFVQAPCKAFYFPENIPGKFFAIPRRPTNYHAYKRFADSLAINQVDLNSSFVSLKQKSDLPLFTMQGIHWSVYGSYIGGDTFINYIEKVRNIKMRHPTWNKIEKATTARGSDDDLAKVANIIFPAANETFSYPVVHYIPDSAARPNILIVGDSFVLSWINGDFLANEFDNWEFWFYNRTRVNKDIPWGSPQPAEWDRQSIIDKADCIILMYTSRGLKDFGNGFVENTFSHYFPAGHAH